MTSLKKIKMQLMGQFLFLHPTYKRLVEFVSETVFLSYIKFYRQNDFKKQLNELGINDFTLQYSSTPF